MKLRVLNYRLSASHSLITDLTNFHDPVAVSDYDAFIFDPIDFQTFSGEEFFRRQREIRDLVHVKSGIVLCILRSNDQMSVVNVGGMKKYGLVDQLQPKATPLIQASVRAGEGSQVNLVSEAKGPLTGYFRVLQQNLRFAAYLETGQANVSQADGRVFAVNSVGYPIAFEFNVGAGRLCFVPVPHGVPGDRVGSAIIRVIETHYGGPTEVDIPSWASEVAVPGANVHDNRITELEEKRGQIDNEISELKNKRTALLDYRRLLFGTGKPVLEPVVRAALGGF